MSQVLDRSAVGVAVIVPAGFAAIAILLGALGSASDAEAAVPSDVTREPMAEESLMPIPDPVELGGGVYGEAPAMASGGATPQAPAPGEVRISYSVPTDDPVAFLTIDDGVHRPEDALAYVQAEQLPVTAFLTTWTVGGHADYFSAITQWGSVQNHTTDHASLAEPDTSLNREICRAQRTLRRGFGSRPWMLRPPYGAGADRPDVARTAAGCGISQIVMWDASVNRGRVAMARGELRPGSILLLHFRPELAKDLQAAVAAIRAAGLEPANLGDYLKPAA